MTEEFHRQARQALAASDPVGALRSVVSDALGHGASKSELLGACEKLRAELPEELEDRVLEVMDFLEGWCSPHERLGDEV